MTPEQHRDLLERLDALTTVVIFNNDRLARIEQQLKINPASFPRLVHAATAPDAPAAAFVVVGNVTIWHDKLVPLADQYVDVHDRDAAWIIRRAGSKRDLLTITKDLPQ